MLVEVDLVEPAKAVERLEQRQLRLLLGLPGRAAEVLDHDAGVDLLLDVDWRRVGDEVGVSLAALVSGRILPAPDELRVEALVPRVANLANLLDRGVDKSVRVGGWDVRPLVAVCDR